MKKIITTILLLILVACSSGDDKSTDPVTPVPDKSTNVRAQTGTVERLQIEELTYIGPPAEKWIIGGIRGTLTNDLRRAALQKFDVLTVEDQNAALKIATDRRKAGEKINLTDEVARILSIDYRCVGQVQNIGGVVRGTLKLLKAPDFKVYKSTTTDKKRTELLELQNVVIENLMHDMDEKITTEAITTMEASKTKSLLAYEFYGKGINALDDNPSQALLSFERAIEIDKNFIDALIQAGRISIYPLSDYKKGSEYLIRAKNILENQGNSNSLEYATILRSLGQSYNHKNELSTAESYYLESKKILENLGKENTDVYVEILRDFGVQNRDLDLIFRGISILEKNRKQNTLLYIDCLIGIAKLYLDEESYDNALSYYSKAQEIAENNGYKNTFQYASILSNIANTLMWKDVYNEKVLNLLNKSKAVRERLNLKNTRGYSFVLTYLGDYYRNKGNNLLALKYYKEAYNLKIKLGVYEDRKRLEDQIQYLETVIQK